MEILNFRALGCQVLVRRHCGPRATAPPRQERVLSVQPPSCDPQVIFVRAAPGAGTNHWSLHNNHSVTITYRIGKALSHTGTRTLLRWAVWISSSFLPSRYLHPFSDSPLPSLNFLHLFFLLPPPRVLPSSPPFHSSRHRGLHHAHLHFRRFRLNVFSSSSSSCASAIDLGSGSQWRPQNTKTRTVASC